MNHRESLNPPHPILVVDDHEDALFGVRRLLEHEGHRVFAARSAEIALALVREQTLHLILVDYSSPKMSVDQLVREIRKVQPFVQVILLTRSNSEAPPRRLLADLDIQGYHCKADGAEKLRLWVAVGLKAHASILRLRERELQHDRLLAHVSHELRNPINVIHGYTELILDGNCGQIPQAAKTPLRALAATTWKLNDLVANFLGYAKLEAQVMTTDPEWVPVDDIAVQLKTIAGILAKDDVCFLLDSECTGARIYTDRAKVITILRNLITNALKFTSRGSIRLHISMSGATIRFAVQDTGSGIAPEEQEAIFEPYRKGPQGRECQSEGVGLGLALSRRLARLLGGDIRVHSEPGMGSTFTLILRATENLRERESEEQLPPRRSLKPSGSVAA